MYRQRVSLSAVFSRAPDGLSAPLVRVEVHLGSGLPAFFIVGLPEAVVRESRERVRAALISSGFDFPDGRITVNLAPADLPKEGGRFDLPIAIGILAASGSLPEQSLKDREFYGELSLSGDLRLTGRLMPAMIAGDEAGHELVIPTANAAEGALIASRRVRMAENLRGVCDALNGRRPFLFPPTSPESPALTAPLRDLADVRGQGVAKRALEIAAAGAHALLLIGPPGSGKTMLAQCLPGLLPPLGHQEALQIASVASSAGVSLEASITRPFRSPQHTASVAALIGGGGRMRPGELTLAHHGVLFLDEIPEFSRDALEALREPLESGFVVLSRAKQVHQFPARFQLVAAMNPCPCGYQGEKGRRCRCTTTIVNRYRGKLSGPLLDRIDMHVHVPALPADQLIDRASGVAESSVDVARRVNVARKRQIARQGMLNGELTGRDLAAVCQLDRISRGILMTAIRRLGLSVRGHDRILKIARTCADLGGRESIEPVDVTQAVAYRSLDRPIPERPASPALLVE